MHLMHKTYRKKKLQIFYSKKNAVNTGDEEYIYQPPSSDFLIRWIHFPWLDAYVTEAEFLGTHL